MTEIMILGLWRIASEFHFEDHFLKMRGRKRLGVLDGDYIYDPSGDGHVLSVTDRRDTNGNGIVDWAEVKVSAHSTNHYNKPISAIYSSPLGLKFMYVAYYKQ